MSVFNRRNAVAGWAAIGIAKRWVRTKLRRKQPPPPTRLERVRSNPKTIGAVLMAAGAGLAAFLGRRRGGKA